MRDPLLRVHNKISQENERLFIFFETGIEHRKGVIKYRPRAIASFSNGNPNASILSDDLELCKDSSSDPPCIKIKERYPCYLKAYARCSYIMIRHSDTIASMVSEGSQKVEGYTDCGHNFKPSLFNNEGSNLKMALTVMEKVHNKWIRKRSEAMGTLRKRELVIYNFRPGMHYCDGCMFVYFPPINSYF